MLKARMSHAEPAREGNEGLKQRTLEAYSNISEVLMTMELMIMV